MLVWRSIMRILFIVPSADIHGLKKRNSVVLFSEPLPGFIFRSLCSPPYTFAFSHISSYYCGGDFVPLSACVYWHFSLFRLAARNWNSVRSVSVSSPSSSSQFLPPTCWRIFAEIPRRCFSSRKAPFSFVGEASPAVHCLRASIHKFFSRERCHGWFYYVGQGGTVLGVDAIRLVKWRNEKQVGKQ